MRIREEQIAHLSCAIFNEKPGNIDDCISLAQEYILEAERRAEQRVRTELSPQIEQQEETIKALQDDLSEALAQIAELTS